MIDSSMVPPIVMPAPRLRRGQAPVGIHDCVRSSRHGGFPSDDAASKLIWLALRNITADWGNAAHHWKEAMNQFAILYAERFTREA